MSQNPNTCHSLGGNNVMTCRGTLFFAKYLIEAQENQNGDLKHNLEICFKPDADLKVLKEVMGKVALDNLDGDKDRAVKAVNKRFIDPNDKPNGGKPAGKEYEGWSLLRASSFDMPDIIMPNGEKCPVKDLKSQCYSGRIVRATLNAYWSKNSSNPGVFLGLTNIQLLEYGTPIGFVKPDGTDQFAAVDIEGGEKPSVVEAATEEKPKSDVDSLFG